MHKKIIILLGILLILYGCNSQNDSSLTGDVISPTVLDTFVIDSNGAFSSAECSAKGLENKVIMLESKYCGHCKETLPKFKEACAEKGIVPEILDVSEKDQRKQMESYGVDIQYTPTFIFGCKYFIGAMEKSDYLKILDGFVN